MTDPANLVGGYVFGTSWLHHWGVARKYLLALALVAPVLVARHPGVTLGLLLAAAVALLSSGTGARRALGLPVALLLILGVTAGYHFFFTSWANSVVVTGNILTCIYASRLVTLTTPVPVLMDGVTQALGWLRWVRVDPERIALAFGLLIRSIPYLLLTWAQVRQAAAARGTERNPVTLFIPFTIGVIAYAQRSGEALAARGLGE